MLALATMTGCSFVGDLDELRGGTAGSGIGGEAGVADIDSSEVVVFQRGGTWHPDQPGQGAELFVLGLESGKLANLTDSAHRYEGRPALSADASRVVFEDYADGALTRLCAMPSGGGTPLCFGGPWTGWDAMPAWSHDGKLLVYVSTRDGKPEIYRMNHDGTGATRLTDDEASDSNPSFSPNGEKVVFASTRNASGSAKDLFTMNANGTAFTQLTHGEGDNDQASFSPDGEAVVFVSNRDGPHEIYTMALGSGGVTRLTRDGADHAQAPANACPSFTRDGKRIVFQSNRHKAEGDKYSIFVMASDGTGTTRLTQGEESDTHPSLGYRK